FDELQTAIRRTKELTDRPFGVNLRASQPDVKRRVELLISEGVRVASFAQAPKEQLIRDLKDAGAVVVPTVGARRHAEKVAAWGVDAVIVQGSEGGGHTGQVPTSLLLPQVVDAVDIPVIAAGGFFDGRGLVAALAYGASGIAMGTRFLLTKESRVPDAVKARYVDASVFDTVVTTAIDGAPQRVIRTDVVDRIERSPKLLRFPRAAAAALRFRKETRTSLRDLLREGWAMKRHQGLSWSQVALAANAPMLIKASMVDGRPEVGVLPTGQVTGVISELPSVAELLDRIVHDAETCLKRLEG
ncbi:MAG TPA: nitronate monooxygenase, partial [Acidimicrobiales bacterium]|nr:nitronate monooxygenase [Acidimicrobiales bacterium]